MTTDWQAAGAELPLRGFELDRFTVTAPIAHGRHALVVQARDEDGSFVALKLASTRLGSELVEREAKLLEGLGADVGPAPRLVATGVTDDRSYNALSWTSGADPRSATKELRADSLRGELLDLAAGVARAYADLHARGIVHGQVHPRHLLVDRDASSGVLDLSLALVGADAPPAPLPTARFNSLSAPEHAQAILSGADVALTAAAEQYSVGALLYLLVTGRMYAPLELEREALARDILASVPRRFADQGAPAWPELEDVLARALHKDPARRYPSLADLEDALRYLARKANRSDATASVVPPVRSALGRLLADFRRDTSSAEAVENIDPPTCSVNFGAAGVAFALTRLGRITGDPTAFEQAERWLARADRGLDEADAFDDGDELTAQTVGVVSPFHNASGVAAVRAFLGEATGDSARHQAALDEYQAATSQPCLGLDLTLGRSSVLLVAALLYARANADWPAAQRLADYGDALCDEIWRDAGTTTLGYNGIAHGWAGIAYAALMWAQARGAEPHPAARPVLDHLAQVSEPCERGVHWPLSPAGMGSDDQFWPGWCHGNAGYVFLWNLAASTYDDARFAELAERAAWLARGTSGVSSLCCGTAGQAYAALNQYRATGDDRWLSVAARLAERGATHDLLAEDATTPLSLYKGHVGLALLSAELERPELASMPLFEFET